MWLPSCVSMMIGAPILKALRGAIYLGCMFGSLNLKVILRVNLNFFFWCSSVWALLRKLMMDSWLFLREGRLFSWIYLIYHSVWGFELLVFLFYFNFFLELCRSAILIWSYFFCVGFFRQSSVVILVHILLICGLDLVIIAFYFLEVVSYLERRIISCGWFWCTLNGSYL